MRNSIRLFVAGVGAVHGLIHLIGAAAAFGWVDIGTMTTPISTGMGIAWLFAAGLLISAAVLLMIGVQRWWWILGGFAAVVSQALIISSWSDSKFGTVANLLLLAAAGFVYASRGPRSYRNQFRLGVSAAMTGSTAHSVMSEHDVAHLPHLVAAYLRQAGSIGQPVVVDFRARFHGRIRGSATKPWMRFTGEQVNTYGSETSRHFFMDATRFGIPIDILHTFVGATATMRVKVCSLIPVVNASGAEMDVAETVTLFNDLCVFAPSALIDAPVLWTTIDERHVRGEFTHGAHTVAAVLTFDDRGELIDFESDDRLRASSNGKDFVSQRWSTPLCDYRKIAGRSLATSGEGRWHAPSPEGEFAYLEFHLDDISYNNGTAHELPRHRFSGATRTS